MMPYHTARPLLGALLIAVTLIAVAVIVAAIAFDEPIVRTPHAPQRICTTPARTLPAPD